MSTREIIRLIARAPLSSDMCFPNNECGILTSVDSDEPVQSPFKLGNSK